MVARSKREDPSRGHRQRALTRALECAENLLDVLDREQKCLGERDLEGITSAAEEKAKLVAMIEQLDGPNRGQVRLPRGPATSPETPDDPATRRLRDLLQRCHIQNQINGHAIQAAAKHVDRSVQILQGVSGTESVYGADGEALSLTASRYVTRA